MGRKRTGCGRVSGTYFTYLKRKAKERDLPFLVTAEDIWSIYQRQNGRCALSGVPIELSLITDRNNNVDRTQHTASLDRIDNNKGYTSDNVQWVHKTVNGMRRQYTIDEYKQWCKLVTEYSNEL